MIYELEDGAYVIASRGMWLPGSYESRSAVNVVQERLITTDDLKGARCAS